MVLIVGCAEEQRAKIDIAAERSLQVAEQIRQVGESPIGLLIPEQVKIWGLLGVILAEAGAMAWQTWRKNTMQKTTRAIVKGIEAAETTSEPKTAQVKASIKTAMKFAGVYEKGNKIVDKLKAS